jgi:hypothetical protein
MDFTLHTLRGGGVIGAAIMIPVLGGTWGGTGSNDFLTGDPAAGVEPAMGDRIGERGRVGLNDVLYAAH